MNNNLSNRIYIIKALCVLTIVTAHTPLSYLNDSLAKELIGSFAMCGVPIFFVISGYFFYKNKKTFSFFWKNKINSIIIPWLIAGLLNYSKRFINGLYIKPIEIVRFILGYKSFLYYLTVLCVLYLVFWKLKDNKKALVLSMVITLIIKYLISFGLIDPIFDNNLNILKWVGFFALGILISKNNKLETIFSYVDGNKLVMFILSLVAIAVSLFFNQMWLIKEVSWTVVFIIVSGLFNGVDKNIFVTIGKASFSIYLYHQFLTTKLFVEDNQLINLGFAILRPLVIVVVLTIVFVVGYHVTNKLSKEFNSIYVSVVGTRL